MKSSKRLEISNTINKLLVEYTPTTCRFEFEDWILNLLREIKIQGNKLNNLDTTFRYRDIYMTFLPGNNLFNATVVNQNGKLFEYTLCLKKFLEMNYGVASLNEADEVLNISDCDLELMAMQITDIMVDFGEYPLMLCCIKPAHTPQEMSENP